MTTAANDSEQIGLPEWERAKPGAIWAWWLRGAGPDGPGLRRWQRWIWWTGKHSLRQRVIALCMLIREWIEAPVEAWGGIRHYGVKTKRVHGVSLRIQFRQLLMLRWRHGVRPQTYYKFQMFRPERLCHADQFVEESGQPLQVICRHSPRTADEVVFIDKEAFRRWCVARAIATVENLIEFQKGELIRRETPSLPAKDLFVKPTNWRQGLGASRWRCVPSRTGHRFNDGAGHELTGDELEEFVRRSSLTQGRPYIVQPALVNHPALRDYSNGALATIRLMTARGEKSSALPFLAALRMPTGGAIADNFGLGGVAAPIDLHTGRCGAGIRKVDEYPADTVEAHPDTGKAIAGLKMPFWEECLALTCRAHDLITAQVPVVGWDVAVLDSGPILVEANHLPGGNIAQMPAGLPLGASPYAEVVVLRLRRLFLTDDPDNLRNLETRRGLPS